MELASEFRLDFRGGRGGKASGWGGLTGGCVILLGLLVVVVMVLVEFDVFRDRD